MSLRDLQARDASRLVEKAGESLVYFAPDDVDAETGAPFKGVVGEVEEDGRQDGAVGDFLRVTACASEVNPAREGCVRRYAGTDDEVDLRILSVRKVGPYVKIDVSADLRPQVGR